MGREESLLPDVGHMVVSYGGVCKHEINSVVNTEVIWRDMLLHLLVIRCIWPADTSFLKANRCQRREIPTIQRAIL